MVSRRNFFSICIMMVVILALFQFSLLVRDIGGSYDTNDHLTETMLAQTDSWASGRTGGSAGTVVYIGSGDKALAKVIGQWGEYTKRRVVQYNSLEEYERRGKGVAPVLLCVAGSEIRTDQEASALSALAYEGQPIVFCDLPEASVIKRLPGLRALLGIQEVTAEEVELTGVKLFSGFLLGGEAIYQGTTEKEQELQDLPLSAPWYLTLSGTKTYMVGLLEDEEIENEALPGLIWRISYGNTQVFVVNGPYMHDQTGLGILSGILYELQSYELHPVVNAQNLSVVNFPNFSIENEGELMGIYARNLRRLQMDLLWPNLIMASNKVGYQMTCFMTPRMDYTGQWSLYPGDVSFYLRQFREQGAEAGVSLDYLQGTDLPKKVEQDLEFFEDAGSEYACGAAYVNSEDLVALGGLLGKAPLENIRTLTGVRDGADPILSYYSANILDQGVTADGFSHTYSQDLRVRALETALGYSNILLDMRHIAWPEEDEPHWELLYETFASNIDTYWKPFSAFGKTTLSESDERVRGFLAMDYAQTRDGNSIVIDISNSRGDCWFLLRTHSESVDCMTGGTYQELEKGAYLICAQEAHVEITLEPDNQMIYYLP